MMDLISAVLIIGIAQGFFTLSLILLKAGVSRSGNLVLIVIILFLIWLQAEFLAVRWPYDVGAMLFYGTRYGSWLVLGPLFLWYVHAITNKKVSISYLLHFLPFIVFALLIPVMFSVGLSRSQVDYGMLNVFNNYGFVYSYIQWFYSGVFIFQFVHFILYTLIALKIIGEKESTLKDSFSGDAVLNIQWLKRLGQFLIVAMAFVIIFIFILFFTKVYRREMDYLYVLPLTFIMYALSYKLAAVRWPSEKIAQTPKKYEKSSLSPDQSEIYRELLESYMTAEKPYLNNGLKLNDLAEALQIPSHHLSRVVNESIGKSFFDYVNEKRVLEAKQLIESGAEMTLLEIAFKAGFNNKNSFTNAFKKNAGVTPSSYKQNIVHSKN